MPRSARGEGSQGCGGCSEGGGGDFSVPSDPNQLQSGSERGEEGALDGTNRSTVDLDLDLLARFLASLSARWLSRQRLSSHGLSLSDLPEIQVDKAQEDFPDCDEEETSDVDDVDDDKGPTLVLLAFRGGDEKTLSSLAALEASSRFQVLAACRDEAGASELASRLSDGKNRPWSWRPLARTSGDSRLLAQLFRRRAAAPCSASSSSCLLVASDYDHTLIDENSDTHVVEALGASETLQSLWKSQKTKEFGWTEAIGEALAAGAAATAKLGERDPEEVVLSAAASVPCSPALRGALSSVCGRSPAGKSNGNHFAILSDANDVFIQEGLRGNGLASKLDLVAVATNPARFVEVELDCTTSTPAHRRLALSRAATRYGGHSCSLCPANLCKGQLLGKLLVAGPGAPYSRGVLYLGDGANDVCPAASCLGPSDAALVRERYGEKGKKTAFGAAVLPSSDSSNSSLPPATKLLCRSVVPWSTQEELAEALMREAGERKVDCKIL